ncbi:MAG: T9SS type A sorting domain-containing protein [Bacteroidales bacterium]|nr:T9SS type A sorting domain-containing protein [Bacteroidales bacterium]
MKRIILFLAISLLIGFMGNAQIITGTTVNDTANYPFWIEMMQDPNANVFETVKVFDKYWENRPDKKGSGYNPFKRWEWYMMHKINPDGSRLPVGYDLNAYENYLDAHRSTEAFAGNWVNIGPIELPASPNPFWGNGRINAIAFHPTDADIFYIGAPAGGLWKTADGGESWEPLTDGQPTLGVSSIIVSWDQPDVIYVGSGDRDAGDAAGLGVFKSTDGGLSWSESSTGMGNVTVGRMIQHPDSASVVFAASNGGIFKTADAGQNWVQKESGGFKDILFKPGDASVLYGVSGARFYRSTDRGENWQRITSGLPTAASRAVIGVSPDNPEYVYFLATGSAAFYGLYRSTDGGTNFDTRSNSPNIMGWACNGGSGGQAWYDLDMAVDPLNAEFILGGGVNSWKSVNGGQSWTMSSNQVGDCGAYPVHADLHVLEYNPADGRLYVGNDGGIWWTGNSGSTWNRITDGLAIGQQYKLGQSKIISNHVTTGYQDNGISIFHTDTWIQSDMYADGMEAAMDVTDTTLSYGCMQRGRMFRMVNDKAVKAIAGQGIGGITEQGNWVTPFTPHEYNPNVMFAGYQNLWRTNNLQADSPSWMKISNGTGSLRVVEHSPADEDIFYFATLGGLHRSDDVMNGTPMFFDLTNQLPSSGAVTDIEAHPWNPEVVYITQNMKVFKSEDRGLNWEDISGTLPTVSLNDIAFYDRNKIEGLYVASNVGVFFKDENMDDWVSFSEGLPAAILASEVEIFHHADDPVRDRIRISSYGRGLWGSIPYHYQPLAGFESSETQVPTGCAIDFYDRSSGYPQNWSWAFEGATPSYSNMANPTQVVYDQAGTYEVSLKVSNAEGADSITITGYITVDDNLLPIVKFMAEDTVECSGGVIRFYDLSEACPVSWEWSFAPNSITYMDGTDQFSQNPLVEFSGTGSYTVSLKVTNSAGESELVREDYISIGGVPIPFYENFEGATLQAKGWEVTNPDGKKTWGTTSIQNGTNQVAWMNFFDYTTTDERDYLTSPLLSFLGYNEVFMSFKYAYAQRFLQKDSLIVKISNDCGESWTRVFAGGPDGEGVFATADPTNEFFEPQSQADWCDAGYGATCPMIDLTDWAGQENIKIQFESFANYGNNLYLANVDISQTVGVSEKMREQPPPFVFYPNPTTGQLTVISFSEQAATLQILDLEGRLVKSFQTENKRLKTDISDLAGGVYLIRLTNGAGTKTKKLVVQ